jgi:hypothetical protein
MSKRKMTKPKARPVPGVNEGAPQEHSADLNAVANVLSSPRDPNRTSVKATADIGNALSVK